MGTKITSHTSRSDYRHRQAGFTIIEVSLFLVLSGFLAVILLTGWTSMLNTQRYKDSVRTLQSFVQQQYNLTYNVENDRGTNLACGNDARVLESTDPGNPPIGQSDCVIMGRYILIDGGRSLTVSSIVGRPPASSEVEADDTEYESIQRYQPKRVDVALGLTDNELSVPWDAVVTNSAADTTPRNHAIVIIRAPSGIVRTFVARDIANPATPPTVTSLIGSASEADLNLCLDPGVPLASGRMGVVVRKSASSQASIEMIADGDTAC